jgi:hypothetical protein
MRWIFLNENWNLVAQTFCHLEPPRVNFPYMRFTLFQIEENDFVRYSTFLDTCFGL